MKHVAWLLALAAACGDDGASPIDAAIDARPSPWTSAPAMPVRRLEPGVAKSGDQIVVVGGFDTSLGEGLDITKRVDALDTISGEWRQLADAPVAWTHIDLAAIGGTIYLLGGLEGAQYMARGEAFALDVGADEWRALPPMPAGQERGAAGVVVSNGHVYLLGGASTTVALATCLDYDIEAQTWTRLPDLPAPRSHPAAMRRADDGTLFVVGGLSTLDATQPLGDVLALPLGATAWEPRTATLATPRGGCVYGVVGENLVCAGGEAGAAALRTVEQYDPRLDQMTTLSPMPEERAGTQGAAVGQRLFVFGGAAQLTFVPTDTVFIYNALDAL